jgi:hypothetical protein
MTKIMRHKGIILLIVSILTLVSAGFAQASSAAQYCYQPTRLLTGTQGRVTLYPNQPNRMRNDPSYYGTVLGYIPAGATFDIISGPICSGYTNWWQVRYNGATGWTAEGDGGGVYWLEPVVHAPPPPACPLTPRLSVGGYGRVTPGLPNTVRSGAGVYGTVRIGQIPAGAVFVVLNGPNCAADGRWWWYVNYNGLIGWTAEGQGTTYWLEPSNGNPGPLPPPQAVCYLATRLSVHGWGRVTPGAPNVLRSAPGTQATGSTSVVIGSIPAGGIFSVEGGPTCGTDGRWWWYVNYNGQLGWTAEGEGNTYWVDPYYG